VTIRLYEHAYGRRICDGAGTGEGSTICTTQYAGKAVALPSSSVKRVKNYMLPKKTEHLRVYMLKP
jgi:hypothetical protein